MVKEPIQRRIGRYQKGEKMIGRAGVGGKVLYEHIRKAPQISLGTDYRLPAKEQESLVLKF